MLEEACTQYQYGKEYLNDTVRTKAPRLLCPESPTQVAGVLSSKNGCFHGFTELPHRLRTGTLLLTDAELPLYTVGTLCQLQCRQFNDSYLCLFPWTKERCVPECYNLASLKTSVAFLVTQCFLPLNSACHRMHNFDLSFAHSHALQICRYACNV